MAQAGKRSAMLRISNVLKRDHPLTPYEEHILDVPKEGLLSLFVLLAVSIRYMQRTSAAELFALFSAFNFVTLALIVWFVYLLGKFLCGCLYIKRLNRAIQQGIRFEGTIIAHRKCKRGWRGFRYQIHQYAVALANGETVESPIYQRVFQQYQVCDVYLYKKKYYFTDFRGTESQTVARIDQ